MPPGRAHPNVDDLPPLRPVETLILMMLTAGDRHGYGLRQDIIDHTSGRVALEAGNLYRHLRRLEAGGCLAESDRPPTHQDERRIYYHLTPVGRRVLAAEMVRLRSLVRLADERRVISPLRP